MFTPQGWEIERENYAAEIVRGFDAMLASGPGPYAMAYLKDRNRPTILRVLDLVRASGDPKYLPLLRTGHASTIRKSGRGSAR